MPPQGHLESVISRDFPKRVSAARKFLRKHFSGVRFSPLGDMSEFAVARETRQPWQTEIEVETARGETAKAVTWLEWDEA